MSEEAIETIERFGLGRVGNREQVLQPDLQVKLPAATECGWCMPRIMPPRPSRGADLLPESKGGYFHRFRVKASNSSTTDAVPVPPWHLGRGILREAVPSGRPHAMPCCICLFRARAYCMTMSPDTVDLRTSGRGTNGDLDSEPSRDSTTRLCSINLRLFFFYIQGT